MINSQLWDYIKNTISTCTIVSTCFSSCICYFSIVATGSPFEEVDACERYGYEFCDVGMVAPDDLDCHYFYQCNQGHWERQECAPPTYFDVDTYLCQQQMFVTCQEECPPYTGAPFPDPGANPKGNYIKCAETMTERTYMCGSVS